MVSGETNRFAHLISWFVLIRKIMQNIFVIILWYFEFKATGGSGAFSLTSKSDSNSTTKFFTAKQKLFHLEKMISYLTLRLTMREDIVV
jgi:hypothetical protein